MWCWDEGYPCAVKLDGEEVLLEPNLDATGAFAGSFRYVKMRSAEGKGNQRNSQLVQYATGLVPAEHVNETYYCVGGIIDDSDPSKITFSVVDSFDINRFTSPRSEDARVPQAACVVHRLGHPRRSDHGQRQGVHRGRDCVVDAVEPALRGRRRVRRCGLDPLGLGRRGVEGWFPHVDVRHQRPLPLPHQAARRGVRCGSWWHRLSRPHVR